MIFIVIYQHVYLYISTDIDECSLAAVTGLQACQGDAQCRNSPGSFTCLCPSGYVIDLKGQSCVGESGVFDHDFCIEQSILPTHECHVVAVRVLFSPP